MQNASRSLESVDNKVQEADRLKNITANLQAQLRQNMSALEEKLRRAREYVAKVKRLLNYECLAKGFHKQMCIDNLWFCILTGTVYFIQSECRGLFSQSSVRQIQPRFGCYQFSRSFRQLLEYSLASDNVICRFR